MNHPGRGKERIDTHLNINGKLLGVSVPVMMIGIIMLLMGIGTQNTGIWMVAAVVLLVNLLLLLSIDCIEINYDRKTIKTYKNYFLFKIGKTRLLKDFDLVAVLYDTSASGGTINGASTSWYGSTYRHYEVFLIGSAKKKLFLKEFYQPKHAEVFQKMVGEKTGIKCVEKVLPNLFAD